MFSHQSQHISPAPWRPAEQKNIIEDRYSNRRSSGIPWRWDGSDPKIKEQHTRLRLWKLLRSMDIPPVLLLHLEEELYQLVKTKLTKQELPKCLYRKMQDLLRTALKNGVCFCDECK